MKTALRLSTLFLALTLSAQAKAGTAPNVVAEVQDQQVILNASQAFLEQQSKGLPGKVTITLGQIDKRLRLASCAELAPFLPQGSKPWGKMVIGVRCTAPSAWVIYVNANVQVSGDYYVTAHPIAQGQTLSANDLNKQSGDLSTMPAGVITSPDQAIGRSLNMSLSAGSVLRGDILKNPAAVQQGQSVRIVGKGNGFQVATDGQSLSNASDGQVAKAKTNSGQVINGIARAGGIIEVIY
jgi:flagellar basal body P-ring formation protein FlgA